MGGGAFILIAMANGTSEVVDAREQAPVSATEEMFVGDPNASLTGGTAVAVPGELQGLRMAWERHGAAPWSDNVLPVAALAESFVVDAEVADAIASSADALRRFEASARLFLPGDRPPAAGATLTNTALAATLRAVAARPDALVRGELATKLAAEIAAAGGSVTADDLAQYAPVLREPLRLDVGGATLLGVPPPSSGGAAVLMALLYLSLLPTPLPTASEALAAHLQLEALKQAFAMRMSLGDPLHVPGVQQVLAAMLSPDFNRALAANHSDASTRPLSEYGGKYNRRSATLPPDGGTAHFSVVDGARNAVAMTTTINTVFGSKVVSAATGIVLNNEMDDFSTPGQPNGYGVAPSAANFIAPGKRPLSSMAPTIVLQDALGPDGTVTRGVRAVAGASGGPRIISGTLQVLSNLLLRGRSAADAVREPRMHHQYLPNVAFAEDWVPRHYAPAERATVPVAVVDGLVARGHEVERWTSHATTQLIEQDLDTSQLHAVSDRRKGGVPAGYD